MNSMRIGPLTKAGEPKHPLYIPYGTPLESMNNYGKYLTKPYLKRPYSQIADH